MFNILIILEILFEHKIKMKHNGMVKKKKDEFIVINTIIKKNSY